MKNSTPTQLTLFPMPQKEIRGLRYANAIRSSLHPYEYKSVVKASCMKAILDFKIWGKTPCLGCCFRDIATGEKFVLYAHDDCHSRRYTPKDKGFDFSQSGIEGSLFYLVTRKTRKGKISWQNARLLPGTEYQSQFGAECRKLTRWSKKSSTADDILTICFCGKWTFAFFIVQSEMYSSTSNFFKVTYR